MTATGSVSYTHLDVYKRQILGMAARRGLLSLPDAIDRLKQTSFHYRQEILDQFLAEQSGKA